MTGTLTARPSLARPPGPVHRRDPGYQAFWILRAGFTVAPILFGLVSARVRTGSRA